MLDLTIAVIASGFLSTLITIFATRRKTTAEAESNQATAIHSISEAWTHLIAPMETRIRLLENESAEKQDQIRCLNTEVLTLRAELESKRRDIEALTTRVYDLEKAGLAKDSIIEGQACRIKELETEVTSLRRKLNTL